MLRKLVLAAAVAALASSAAAQPRAPGGDEGFFISPAGEPFRGDDGLADWFAGADGDKDGALTLAEFRADAQRFFKRVDANGDGRIDRPEVQVYEARIAPEVTQLSFQPGLGGSRRRSDEGFGGGAGSQPQSPKRPQIFAISQHALLNTPHPVRAADEDFNGSITQEEWLRAARRRFEMIDKAKAGKLVLAELRPAGPPPKRR